MPHIRAWNKKIFVWSLFLIFFSNQTTLSSTAYSEKLVRDPNSTSLCTINDVYERVNGKQFTKTVITPEVEKLKNNDSSNVSITIECFPFSSDLKKTESLKILVDKKDNKNWVYVYFSATNFQKVPIYDSVLKKLLLKMTNQGSKKKSFAFYSSTYNLLLIGIGEILKSHSKNYDQFLLTYLFIDTKEDEVYPQERPQKVLFNCENVTIKSFSLKRCEINNFELLCNFKHKNEEQSTVFKLHVHDID